VDRLSFGIGGGGTDSSAETPIAEPTEARQRANSSPFVTRLLPDPSEPLSTASEGSSFPEGFPAPAPERDIGFEPTTFSLGS
jgi:hypothetical protein